MNHARVLTVHLSEEDWVRIDRLVLVHNRERDREGLPRVNEAGLVEILLRHAAEGIGRPGSWEFQWIAKLFGETEIWIAGEDLR